MVDARPPADAAPPICATAYIGTFLGGVHALAVDPATGGLEEPGVVATGSFYGIALHPSRAVLYTVDLDHAELFAYAVSAGTLTPLAGSPLAIGGHPTTIAVDPLGRFVYVSGDTSIGVFAIDPSSGAVTGPVANAPLDADTGGAFVAAEPSGRFVYLSTGPVAAIAAFAVDAGGALTPIAGSPFALPQNGRPGAIAFDGHGHLYYGAGKLYGFAIDVATGAPALLPGAPFVGDVGSDAQAIDVAVDPLGRYVYSVTNAGLTVSASRIDPATGALSPVPGSPFPAGEMPYSVAVEPTGRIVYVGNDDAGKVSALAIDATTGALSPVAGSPFDLQGLQPQLVLGPCAP